VPTQLTPQELGSQIIQVDMFGVPSCPGQALAVRTPRQGVVLPCSFVWAFSIPRS
jgi:hypothetical protein